MRNTVITSYHGAYYIIHGHTTKELWTLCCMIICDKMSTRLYLQRLTAWRYLLPRLFKNNSKTYSGLSIFTLQHSKQNTALRLVKGRHASLNSNTTSPTTRCLSNRYYSSGTSDSKGERGEGEGGKAGSNQLKESDSDRHPDAEKEPLPEWPEGVNPHTGERGGPKGPEPTRYGDWERKGRVSDF